MNGKIQVACDLTPTQREVLRRLAEGQTVKEIAVELGIKNKTVEYHRGELVRATGLANLALLTKLAIHLGLTAADNPLSQRT